MVCSVACHDEIGTRTRPAKVARRGSAGAPAWPSIDQVTPAAGAVVEAFSHWVDGFGYMTMERAGPSAWTTQVWDRHGKLQNTCRVEGRRSRCELASVPAPVTP